MFGRVQLLVRTPPDARVAQRGTGQRLQLLRQHETALNAVDLGKPAVVADEVPPLRQNARRQRQADQRRDPRQERTHRRLRRRGARQARERRIAAKQLVPAGSRQHRFDAGRRDGSGDVERIDGVGRRLIEPREDARQVVGDVRGVHAQLAMARPERVRHRARRRRFRRGIGEGDGEGLQVRRARRHRCRYDRRRIDPAGQKHTDRDICDEVRANALSHRFADGFA